MLKKSIIILLWLSFGYLLFGDKLIYIFSDNIKYLGMNRVIIGLFIKYILLTFFLVTYIYVIRKKYNYKILDFIICALTLIIGLSLLNNGDNPNRIETIGIINRTSEIRMLSVDKIYFSDLELKYKIKPGEKIQFRVISSPISKIDNNTVRIYINNGKNDVFYERKIEDLLRGGNIETELFIDK